MRRIVYLCLILFLTPCGITFIALSRNTWQVPEDFPTIQAAINAAQPGDTIRVKTGVYEEQLSITKSLILQGAGVWNTVLIRTEERTTETVELNRPEDLSPFVQIQNKVVPLIHIESDSPIEVMISGFTLIRAGFDPLISQEELGILVSGSARLEITDSLIFNQRGAGILVDGEAQGVIRRCRSDNEYGVSVRGHGIVVIEESDISDNRRAGIVANYFGQVKVFKSVVANNGEGGVMLLGCSKAEIKENFIYGNGFGIAVLHSAEAYICSNIIQENHSGGISVTDGAPGGLILRVAFCDRPLRAFLLNNQIVANEKYGIQAIGYRVTPQIYLEGNQISDSVGDGISVGGLILTELHDNKISGNRGAGIRAAPPSTVRGGENVIRGNGCDLVGNVLPELLACGKPSYQPSELHVPVDVEDLQEAIDIIAPGGVIYIADGNYNGGLTVWKPLKIQGEGQQVVLMGNASAPVISVLQGVEGIVIENLTIVGGEHGLLVYGCGAIRNCKIFGNEIGGVTTNGSAELKIDSCLISNNDFHGLGIYEESLVIGRNIQVKDNAIYGIEIGGTLVLDNSVISGSGWGITQTRGKATIQNTEITENKVGIQISGAATSTVISCIIFGNRDGCLVGYPARTTVARGISGPGEGTITVQLPEFPTVVFVDNVVGKNERYGIRVHPEATLEGSENKVFENGIDMEGSFPPHFLWDPMRQAESSVLYFPGPYKSLQETVNALPSGGTIIVGQGEHQVGTVVITKPLTLKGPEEGQAILSGNAQGPVLILACSQPSIIVENIFICNGKTGVAVFGSHVLRDCVIEENMSLGVLIEKGSVIIQNCSIVNNGGTAVLISDLGNAEFNGCTIENNSGSGITCDSSGHTKVTKTTVRNNNVGILIFPGVDRALTVEVWDSQILNNKTCGVRLETLSFAFGRVTVKGGRNEIHGNGQGEVCPPALAFLATEEGGSYGVEK